MRTNMILIHIFFVRKEIAVYVVNRWLCNDEFPPLPWFNSQGIPHIDIIISDTELIKLEIGLRAVKKPAVIIVNC